MTIQKQTQPKKKEVVKEKGAKAANSRALVKNVTPEDFKLLNETFFERDKIDSEELKMVQNFLKGAAYLGGDPKDKIPKIAQVLAKPWLAALKGKDFKRTIKESTGTITEDVNKALVVYGLETHFPLSQSVEEQLKPQVIEFSHQLIQEYDCKTSGEKALAEIVVGAYARILQHSRIMKVITSTTVTPMHVGFYSVLSKELDRANRHFITALTTLKQLKAPSLEINVNTKNAFVAQNQQINAINNSTTKENEIVDPK